ncbi:unnamed protein product [Calicophoron daubneyi]|uniref:N-acetylgalactosaminide beta-1,3-galactosyltransferase n=2 Tax=Calicophoron daubneyi TaxID=300641 RepID=A0AAV2SWM6_CALDB
MKVWLPHKPTTTMFVGFRTQLFIIAFLLGMLAGLFVSRMYILHKIKMVSEMAVDLDVDDYEDKIYGHKGESIIADALARKIRVVCMIMTMPKAHKTKALAVQRTWANRCNAYFFVSSEVDANLHAVAGVEKEGREALWDKTKFAIKHAVKHYTSNYDYFVKADDDTFLVLENLRKLLLDHRPDEPFIMGRRFKPFVKQGYLSGGGGYVMSKAALLKIADGLQNATGCAGNESGGAEDVRLGKCAEMCGVKLIDSLDEQGMERFHPFPLGGMMSEGNLNATGWIWSYNFHKLHSGLDCCSDYTVSFHYISEQQMYEYNYFLYHLHPYGIHRDFKDVIKLVRNRGNWPLP